MKKRNTKLYILLAVLALALILSLLFIYSSQDTPIPETPTPTPTVTVTPTPTPSPSPSPTPTPSPTPEPEPTMLPRFDALYEENEDLVGWITVPGTEIDHPVVQGEDNAYYLSHNFQKENQRDGTIFLDFTADILEKNRSLSLFGHHRYYGGMFSDLHSFKKLDHLKQYPVFSFDSLYEESEYVVFSVFYMAGNASDKLFYYYPKSDFETDEDFEAHIKQITDRSIYLTGVDVSAYDRLVLLTCCSYETDDLRIIIAGRKLREGEDADSIDTSGYTVNPALLYPQKWYDKFGGSPPAN